MTANFPNVFANVSPSVERCRADEEMLTITHVVFRKASSLLHAERLESVMDASHGACRHGSARAFCVKDSVRPSGKQNL